MKNFKKADEKTCIGIEPNLDTSTVNLFFNDVKKLYVKFRKHEHCELKKLLKAKGINVKLRGGAGRTNYRSGGQLNKKYDLSNWLYIEASINDVNFFISFQPFDIDPNSHNQHALFDRIGISAYRGKYTTEKVLSNMIITDIELPLNDKKRNKICKIMYKMETEISNK